MKRCPTCNREFTDPTLSFCIDDGTTLVRARSETQFESQPTALFSDPPPTMHMPPPAPTKNVADPFTNRPPQPPPYGWASDSPQRWVAPPPPIRPTSQQQTLAILSMILGLLAITFGWICGGPVLGLFSVILGAVALMQIKSNPIQYSGRPFAFIGIFTGGLVLLFTVAMFVFWLVMMIVGMATS